MSVSIGTVEGWLKLHDEFTGVLTRAGTQLIQSGPKFKKLGQELTEVGGGLTKALTVPLVAAGGGAIKLAAEFESSFAGVRKTLNVSEGEAEKWFGTLSSGFREMSKDIPINVNLLNEVGEAAGQLGVEKEDVLSFTKTMAELGVTTNLSATEAATSIARFSNVMGTLPEDIERTGSTLVALGNAFAANEQEIMSMSMRLMGAGKQIKLTEGEVMAIATTLTSVGISAEAGGSAFSKVMIEMADAVSNNTENLSHFANVSGVTTSEFSRLFREDASQAIEMFVSGLGGMFASGGNVLGVLADMGIEEVRMRNALLSASGAGDLLNDTLELQATAWDENTALTKEAETRFGTFESKLTLFWNRLKDVGITLGQSLVPLLSDLLDIASPVIDVFASWVEKFANLPTPIRAVVAVIGALAAAAGPVLLVVGQLISAWGTFAASTIGKALIPRLLGLIGIVTGPVGWIAAGVSLLLMWKPLRDFLFDLGTRVIRTLRDWVGNIVDSIKSWWSETESGRRFLAAFAKVIIDDVVAGVKTFWTWIGNISSRVVSAISDFLEWSGILSGVQVVVGFVKDTIKTLWTWVGNVATRVVDWVDSMGGTGGLLSILASVVPGAGAIIDKFKEWADRAKEAITETDNLSDSVEDAKTPADSLTAALTSVNGTITALGTEAASVATDVSDSFGDIEDSYSGLDTGIVTPAASIATTNQNIIDSMPSGLPDGIVNSYTSLDTSIVTPAGNIATTNQSIVDSMPTGLPDGIKDSYTSLDTSIVTPAANIATTNEGIINSMPTGLPDGIVDSYTSLDTDITTPSDSIIETNESIIDSMPSGLPDGIVDSYTDLGTGIVTPSDSIVSTNEGILSSMEGLVIPSAAGDSYTDLASEATTQAGIVTSANSSVDFAGLFIPSDPFNLYSDFSGHVDGVVGDITTSNDSVSYDGLMVPPEAGESYSDLSSTALTAFAEIVSNSQPLRDSLSNLVGTEATNQILGLVDTFTSAFSQIKDNGGSTWDAIKGGFRAAADDIANALSSLADHFFAEGKRMEGTIAGLGSAVARFATGDVVGGIAAIATTFINFRKGMFDSDAVKNEIEHWGVTVNEELEKAIRDMHGTLGNAGAALRTFLVDVLEETGISSLTELRNAIDLTRLVLMDLANGFTSSTQAGNIMAESLDFILGRFAEVGGTISELNQIVKLYEETLASVAAGQLSVDDAVNILNSSFGSFVDAARTLGEEGVEAIYQVVTAINEAGLEVESIALTAREVWSEAMDVMSERAQFLVDSSTTVLDSLWSMFEEGVALSQGEFESLSSSAVIAFTQMLEAGVPLSVIYNEHKDLLSELETRAAEYGLTLSDEFLRLSELGEILSTGPMQKLLTKMELMTSEVSALGEMGVLTEERFRQFGNSTLNQYQRMIDAGMTQDEILREMGPQLQLLHDLQQKYGFAVNDSTQALIDQGFEQGILTDQQLSFEDITIRFYDNMLQALDALIAAMGGVPLMFDDWASSADDAADAIVGGGGTGTGLGGRVIKMLGDIGNEGEATFNNLADDARHAANRAANAWDDVGDSIDDLPPYPDNEEGNQGGRSRGGAQHGTRKFMDFGSRTTIPLETLDLHGREEIVSFQHGQSVAAMVQSGMSQAITEAFRQSAAGVGAGGREDEKVALLAQTANGVNQMVNAFMEDKQETRDMMARDRLRVPASTEKAAVIRGVN